MRMRTRAVVGAMPVDSDLLILGGGCAGLSLGVRLGANPGRCARTVIVESRSAYANDRTWCFWKQPSDHFAHLATHAWSALQLRAGNRTVRFPCGTAPYQMLPAEAFYTEACRLIQPSHSVDLLQGIRVTTEPRRFGDVWKVETDQGALTARQIIDTRPPGPDSPIASTLWQSFAGQEVVCESGSFDPRSAMLMHFAESTDKNIHFTYVLPMTRERALVESTVFGPNPLPASFFTELQARAVARECRGAAFRVLRSEYGVLPMGIVSPRASANTAGLTRVGVMRGAARPATGYAFGRIQRWAEQCATALRDGRPAQVHRPDHLYTRLMDSLFLNVLRTRPDLAPRLFLDLFEKVEPARLIRFLSDAGSFADHVAIAAALPTVPFLRALFDPHGVASPVQPGAP
jgi:lycopene beta-cyclase